MPIIFPDPNLANEDGIVAVGGHLTPDFLTAAYLKGIFPWPIEESAPLTWFSPDPRGILEIKDLHFPKSFLKFLKKHPYEIRINQDFKTIIKACANTKRADQSDTWIFEGIIKGYTALFEDKKNAYCIGIYENNKLIAGIYGVCFGDLISGESMFHRKSNASKLALHTLLQLLKDKNIPFLDTQMVTSVVESFGGKYIERVEFLEKIRRLDTKRQRSDIFGS